MQSAGRRRCLLGAVLPAVQMSGRMALRADSVGSRRGGGAGGCGGAYQNKAGQITPSKPFVAAGDSRRKVTSEVFPRTFLCLQTFAEAYAVVAPPQNCSRSPIALPYADRQWASYRFVRHFCKQSAADGQILSFLPQGHAPSGMHAVTAAVVGSYGAPFLCLYCGQKGQFDLWLSGRRGGGVIAHL